MRHFFVVCVFNVPRTYVKIHAVRACATLHYSTCIDLSFDIIHRHVMFTAFSLLYVRTYNQNTYITCAHGIHTSCGISKFTHKFALQGTHIHRVPCMHASMHTNILELKRLRSTLPQHSTMHSKVDLENRLIGQNQALQLLVQLLEHDAARSLLFMPGVRAGILRRS